MWSTTNQYFPANEEKISNIKVLDETSAQWMQVRREENMWREGKRAWADKFEAKARRQIFAKETNMYQQGEDKYCSETTILNVAERKYLSKTWRQISANKTDQTRQGRMADAQESKGDRV